MMSTMKRTIALSAAVGTIALSGCCLVVREQIPATPGPPPPAYPCDIRALGLNGSYYSPDVIAEACERGLIVDPNCPDNPGQVYTVDGTCVWPNYDERGVGDPWVEEEP